jgi:hypothetical protein
VSHTPSATGHLTPLPIRDSTLKDDRLGLFQPSGMIPPLFVIEHEGKRWAIHLGWGRSVLPFAALPMEDAPMLLGSWKVAQAIQPESERLRAKRGLGMLKTVGRTLLLRCKMSDRMEDFFILPFVKTEDLTMRARYSRHWSLVTLGSTNEPLFATRSLIATPHILPVDHEPIRDWWARANKR